jgi:hypothetical protein
MPKPAFRGYGMRTLLAIVVLAALGWSAWWWFNASMRERALERWLADRRADGWQAEAADLRVTGFPNRVDTIVTDLHLADPEAGWSWHAAEFQILSLTWAPHRFIVALPGVQAFSTPYETLTTTSDLLRGSVAFRPNTRLELDHSTFEIEGMQVASDLGWTAEIGKAILATRQAEGRPFGHDIAFDADSILLPEALVARAGGVLPAAIGPVEVDTTATFDRAWDRPSVEGENPELVGIDVRRLSLDWGDLALTGNGSVTADAEGLASGNLDLEARNWRAMLDLAERTGALPSGVAAAIRAGLGLFASFGGAGGDMLGVPLSFEDGRTRLGPVAIGPAPRLTRRPPG